MEELALRTAWRKHSRRKGEFAQRSQSREKAFRLLEISREESVWSEACLASEAVNTISDLQIKTLSFVGIFQYHLATGVGPNSGSSH